MFKPPHPIVDIFSDDDSRDFVEDGGAGAHLTGAEGRDQDQFMPVVPPARVLEADHFRVSRWVSVLDSPVVTFRDHL